jgi:hypothetical protein
MLTIIEGHVDSASEGPSVFFGSVPSVLGTW